MILELGLAVGGGILNALAGAEKDRENEKRKQSALAMLRENIIDPNELDTMLQGINRMFNNRLVSTLNSTALRSKGIVNSGVMKAAAAGNIEGARLGTLSDTRFKVADSNRSTYSQMAGVEVGSGKESSVVGDFFSGALTALPAAMEAGKMFSPSVANTLGAGAGVGEGTTKAIDSKGFMGHVSKNITSLEDSNYGSFGKMFGRGF